MSTIDMTQVAGIQAVNAEGKVIGTLTVDDLTELVATKIVQEAKNEAVSARSASVMSEASTLAATDEYEDRLDIDTNPAYIRSLDTNGNPKRTAIASLASVVGGLLPDATPNKRGIMSSFHAQQLNWPDIGFQSNGTTKLYKIAPRYSDRIYKLLLYTDVAYMSEYNICGSGSTAPRVTKVSAPYNVYNTKFYYDSNFIYLQLQTLSFGTKIKIINLSSYNVILEKAEVSVSTLTEITVE